MYYLLTAVSLAVSLAASGIVTEIGTKYLARYVVENEISDVGIDPPSARSVRETSDTELHALDRVSPVTPILVAGLADDLPVDLQEERNFANAGEAVMSDATADPLPTAGVQVASIPPDADLPRRTEPAMQPARPAAPDASAAEEVEESEESQAAEGVEEIALALPDREASALYELMRDTPHRRDDGTAFLPIAAQRVFSVAWQVSRLSRVPLADELAGRIVTDPGTGTNVHAEVTGVVRPHGAQFPFVGMRVTRGEPLAILSPTFAASERAQIEARIQQLTNLISLTDKQIQRLKDVLFVRYRDNKIEALKVERHGYRRELAALQKSIGAEQTLRAPVDGVISGISVSAGGTAQQGQIVFEVVDPTALWVEAAAYDLSSPGDIESAWARLPDGTLLELDFAGGGLVLANQAVPLRFRIRNAGEGLTVGRPVTVIVQKGETATGIAVPASSVLQDGDGRSIVWERVSAETFRARPVDAIRVAGDTMLVRSGLSDGARVVTEGVAILSQIR